ncbi:MAG: Histidyl-tRNA synthetase [Ktedonobacterales bacterium]|jgi:histidyl-tRNA synthetase|nr:MAG: Histidyl-tRNA synthetase [Ktedonobacterales bacterium]
MARIAPVNARGTRDFLPRDLVRRNRVFALLRATFERYGFEPLETPSIENTSVLEGKYGEEGDRLLFRILKRGRELESGVRALDALSLGERSTAAMSRALSDEALRYDLTVPFARVIAAHQNDIVLPFRRYQMQPVWRADKPQRGRYREFYQCDVDCVGSRSMTVDAEMVAIHQEVFAALGFSGVVTRINHRGLLAALMATCDVPEEQYVATLTTMDKLDKIGLDGVRTELSKASLSDAAVDRLTQAMGLTGTPETIIESLRPIVGSNPMGAQALDELAQVFGYLADMGVPAERLRFDLSVVRGLGYYTGTIYETVLTNSTLGSLGGGGRYDQLIGMFLGRDLPCVGISFGLERIFDALDEQELARDEVTTTTQALVTLFAAETLASSFALATELRAAGIRTEVYTEPKDLRPQLTFASKKGIPLALILGPDELANDTVALRDLRAGAQRIVPRSETVAAVQSLLTGES